MGKLIFASLLFSILGSSAQAIHLNCEYNFSAAPMGNIKFTVDENGIPGEYADVSLFFTGTKQMPLTNEVPGPQEFLRMTISKDDPNNELGLIVHEPANGIIKSTLINKALSGGMNKLTGTCKDQ